MSRRPDPIAPELNVALRAALRLAADSIEPTNDGLDKIQTKIVARKTARASRWRARPARVGGADESWWRSLRPSIDWLLIRAWLAGALGAVIERFRPDPGRIGWLGWLRPIAAVGTGLVGGAGAPWAGARPPERAQSEQFHPVGARDRQLHPWPASSHRDAALHRRHRVSGRGADRARRRRRLAELPTVRIAECVGFTFGHPDR